MKVPNYTNRVIQGRATPQMVDYGAVNSASGVARAVSKAADFGAQLIDAHQQANETTLFNEKSIEAQKEVLIYTEQARKDNKNNPFGFSKRAEDDVKKIYQKYEDAMPSERAKKAWREAAAQQGLSNFKSNFGWENTRSAQIYAERTEKAARDLNEMAYLAGRTGGDLSGIQRNVDATVVSTGSYQPDKGTLARVSERMSSGASMAYLRGLSESDPLKALEMIDAGAFNKSLPAEKLFKMKKALAQDAIIQVAEDDALEAREMLKSDAIKSVFSPREYSRIEKQMDRAIEQQEIKRNTDIAIHTNNIMLEVINGNITSAGLEANESLTERDKSIASALMIGNTEAIAELSEIARKSAPAFDDVNSATLVDAVRQQLGRFDAAKGKRATAKDVTQKLNTIRDYATLAHANNKSNRGAGLSKTEYNAVIKEINKAQETIGESGSYNKYRTRNVFDAVVDEVRGMTKDKAEQAKLIGYATAWAEQKNIDVFKKLDEASDAEDNAKTIFKELSEQRRKSLGIRPSAPRTGAVIKDGEIETVGDDDGSVVADRSVNVPAAAKPIKTKAEYDALPSGQAYMHPDGKIRVKP